MSCQEQAALEAGAHTSSVFATAARHLAESLLAKLPPIAGPAPVRTLLVIVGVEGLARRNGRGGDGSELKPYAVPLVHTTVASLLLEHPSIHVHLASTEDKAMEFVGIVAAVCNDEALLTQSA
uniref:Uncharacterized protein n=1 Tax=Haptolina brevifila TaxID=156173 RepID=A0A7S2HXT5_9EUKA|mmetsp:Transcript_5903/g.12414  ORF Transcript_5903/g.12414 Transcript_5903/m.12414 type:complete len:123 (+) Transcript_5903:637-1005(+)